jgi:hypothetical protein
MKSPRLLCLPLVFAIALPANFTARPAGAAAVPAMPKRRGALDDVREAQRSFELAVTLYQEGDLRGALSEFRRAHEIFPSYKVLYNLALVSRELRDWAGALEYYRKYLDEAGHGFAWEMRYHGKLQFLVVQGHPSPTGEANAFHAENDAAGSGALPVTEPMIYNASLCGRKVDPPQKQLGIVVRRAARASVTNAVITGFEAGVEVQGGGAALDVQSTLFANPVALTQDESQRLLDPARKNSIGPPNIGDCFDPNKLGFAPSPSIRTGATIPPGDGFFDGKAVYLGAFRDFEDNWTRGAWLSWSDR